MLTTFTGYLPVSIQSCSQMRSTCFIQVRNIKTLFKTMNFEFIKILRMAENKQVIHGCWQN